MNQSSNQFLTLIQVTSTALLDATTTDQRQYIADQIATDPELTTAVLLLLTEAIVPLLPDVAPDGLIQ